MTGFVRPAPRERSARVAADAARPAPNPQPTTSAVPTASAADAGHLASLQRRTAQGVGAGAARRVVLSDVIHTLMKPRRGPPSSAGIPATPAAPAPTAPHAFALVGGDMTREIARGLHPAERLRLAVSQRAASVDLAPMLPSARRTVAAGEVTSLASFRSILDETTLAASAAPNTDEAHGRLETMSALARQVQRLPQREQIGAFEALREALAGPAGLDIAVDLAALRSDIARGLESNVNDVASSGVNVARLVEFLGITDIEHINFLQLIAVRSNRPPESAWAAATSGRRIPEVADEFGITYPPAIFRLERAQVDSTNPASAGFAVRAGSHVMAAAQQHGITTPDGLIYLQQAAARSEHPNSAGYAARAGGNVVEIATAFGITHPAARHLLELAQIESTNPASAGFAVRAGGDVGTLARQHGITTEAGLLDLQSAVFYHSASLAVLSGEDPHAVSQRYGIVDRGLIGLLEHVAATVHQA